MQRLAIIILSLMLFVKFFTGVAYSQTDKPSDYIISEVSEEISPPFAKGELQGTTWEVRFNFPDCNHPGHPINVWCVAEDYTSAAQKSGVEIKLENWINNPKIKSIKIATFSFANKNIKNSLCRAANNRGLKVDVYLHSDNTEDPNVKELSVCSPNIRIYPRGRILENGYLQHIKIFLASELDNPLPFSDLTNSEAKSAENSTTRFTSSSANMSEKGTSLSFDNWLFFEVNSSNRLVQEQLCLFKALGNMLIDSDIDERKSFVSINQSCLQQIKALPLRDIEFIVVPNDDLAQKPYKVIQETLESAQHSIKVAAHHFTITKIANLLVSKARSGIKVNILLDDDTFRTGQCNGGASLDMSPSDVKVMRILRDSGVETALISTNGELGQLQHNKFIIVDNKTLFQGSGNFTSTSLNTYKYGNMEHFYVITVPEIVKAYEDGWHHLRSLATLPQEHEVYNNLEKPLKETSNTQIILDDSVCIN